MSFCVMIPVMVRCDCGWSESLDADTHGPFECEIVGDVLANDLTNRPTVCPTCGNASLKVEHAPGGVPVEFMDSGTIL